MQTKKAEVGPTSGPTWRLSHLSDLVDGLAEEVAAGAGVARPVEPHDEDLDALAQDSPHLLDARPRLPVRVRQHHDGELGLVQLAEPSRGPLSHEVPISI
jgi:hypothetical protein